MSSKPKKETAELCYTWDTVYSKLPSTFEFLADNVLHLHYLLKIIKLKPKKLLEIGCGTASHSIFLSFFLPNTMFCCLDNNEKVINIAKHNAKKYRKNIDFILGDAFYLSRIFKQKEFDVAISQGLLEHFSDREIQKLVDEQLYVARTTLINVPSEHYPGEGILGERRISKEEWKEILGKYRNKGHLVELKNLRDLGIRTRIMALKRDLSSIFKPMHYVILIMQ